MALNIFAPVGGLASDPIPIFASPCPKKCGSLSILNDCAIGGDCFWLRTASPSVERFMKARREAVERIVAEVAEVMLPTLLTSGARQTARTG